MGNQLHSSFIGSSTSKIYVLPHDKDELNSFLNQWSPSSKLIALIPLHCNKQDLSDQTCTAAVYNELFEQGLSFAQKLEMNIISLIPKTGMCQNLATSLFDSKDQCFSFLDSLLKSHTAHTPVFVLSLLDCSQVSVWLNNVSCVEDQRSHQPVNFNQFLCDPVKYGQNSNKNSAAILNSAASSYDPLSITKSTLNPSTRWDPYKCQTCAINDCLQQSGKCLPQKGHAHCLYHLNDNFATAKVEKTRGSYAAMKNSKHQHKEPKRRIDRRDKRNREVSCFDSATSLSKKPKLQAGQQGLHAIPARKPNVVAAAMYTPVAVSSSIPNINVNGEELVTENTSNENTQEHDSAGEFDLSRDEPCLNSSKPGHSSIMCRASSGCTSHQTISANLSASSNQRQKVIEGGQSRESGNGKPQTLHDRLHVDVQDSKANSQPLPRVPLVPAIPCTPNGESSMSSSVPLHIAVKTMNIAEETNTFTPKKLKSKPHLGESGPQNVIGVVCHKPTIHKAQTSDQANEGIDSKLQDSTDTTVCGTIDHDLRHSILSYPAQNSPLLKIQNIVISGVTSVKRGQEYGKESTSEPEPEKNFELQESNEEDQPQPFPIAVLHNDTETINVESQPSQIMDPKRNKELDCKCDSHHSRQMLVQRKKYKVVTPALLCTLDGLQEMNVAVDSANRAGLKLLQKRDIGALIKERDEIGHSPLYNPLQQQICELLAGEFSELRNALSAESLVKFNLCLNWKTSIDKPHFIESGPHNSAYHQSEPSDATYIKPTTDELQTYNPTMEIVDSGHSNDTVYNSSPCEGNDSENYTAIFDAHFLHKSQAASAKLQQPSFTVQAGYIQDLSERHYLHEKSAMTPSDVTSWYTQVRLLWKDVVTDGASLSTRPDGPDESVGLNRHNGPDWPDTVLVPDKVKIHQCSNRNAFSAFTSHTTSLSAFPGLHVPHDFVHMTPELHLINPLNERGDNVLHIAVDIWGGSIASIKHLLKHDSVSRLITENNQEDVTPLNTAELQNLEVFKCFFIEAYRSMGRTALKQLFPKYFIPGSEHFLNAVEVLYACEEPVDDDTILYLAIEQLRERRSLCEKKLVGIAVTDSDYSVCYKQKYSWREDVAPDDATPGDRPVPDGSVGLNRHNGPDWPDTVPDIVEIHECSNKDFGNASLCLSTQYESYHLFEIEFNKYLGCCSLHKIEQHVVISCESSPVLPYLGRKFEFFRQGRSESRHTNCRYNQLNSQSVSKSTFSGRMQQDLSKKQLHVEAGGAVNESFHHVEADGAVNNGTKSKNPKFTFAPRPHDQHLTVYFEHFNLAADCLHAQDYVRMLHSLPHCLICNPTSNLPDHKIQIAYLFGCGLAHTKLSKQKEALKHFQTCEAIAVNAEQKGDVALCNQNLGDIFLARQSFVSAAQHYSKAIDHYAPECVAQNFKMIIPSISGLYAKLASALRNASKVVDAVQAYRNAIATAESKKDKLSAHTSLGNLYQSVGENSSALTEYEHSIKLSEELEDYVSLGWAHGNMGNACLGLYQRDKALYHLGKSLELALNYEPTPQAIGRAYNNLGTAHQALNEYDKAQDNYDLALGQGIYGNDIPGQARVYGNIGNLLMVRQDYERAIPHYTEVLRLSKDRSTVSTAYHNRGCAYYELAESKKVTILGKRTEQTTFYVHGLECTPEYQPLILSSSIAKLYRHGSRDLEEVVKFHEETLNSIKGSTKGLTLSVSLFESNSRTFHRLQDCLVSLGEWEKALVVAEQSRARTLGELLLKKKEWQLEDLLSAPLTLNHITSIVKSQSMPVLYLSYTGARLLGWVLSPNSEMGMFEVPLKDDQFEGKSLDYHLRYSLNEVLVEKSFEMYRSLDYSSKLNDPVVNLYDLIGKPLCNVLKQLNTGPTQGVQSVLVIPDSYTNLLPFSCLLAVDEKADTLRFLGDQYSFQLMPSLLTMGILDQLPSTTVKIPADSRDMCVVGNPTIPPFTYNREPWNLGKLPYATKEAQWVAHILGTTPILHEQATKSAVLMRILNSKIIHIATHGSAAAGFLAFAGITSSSSLNKEAVDSGSVLIYPRDIEKLSISPALVVLSSCDSGRGEMKADGIQGMARAFILAGAQAVLTTLWRVPDESACIFMQFFYQYLVDGFCGSKALQKAILSVRCFSKYSQYIHWSGYQLTGREIQFDVKKADIFQMLETHLGPSSVFPRLDDMKKLESALINDPRTPTDVQILRGSPGMKPSEPLIDFIHSFHHHFKGGIFWVNGRTKELLEASTTYIEKVTGKLLPEITASDAQQILVVLDYFEYLPSIEAWIKLLKNPSVHIVVISKYYSSPELLRKEIDHQLLRGCNVIKIQPLSMVHTIQRIVHSIHEQHHLAPGNEEQGLFERLAEFTSGCPAIIDAASGLLLSQMKQTTSPQKSLRTFAEAVSLFSVRENLSEYSFKTICKPPPNVAKVREISKNTAKNIPSVISTSNDDPWQTDVHYDSWQTISKIIAASELSNEEQLLLYSLSIFHCYPIPMSIVTEISVLIAKASHKVHLVGNLHSKLFMLKFLRIYPTPIVLHPSQSSHKLKLEPEFVYVPQYLSSGIWKHIMSPVDKAASLGTVFKTLSIVSTRDSSRLLEEPFLPGLWYLLLEMFELNFELMGKQCYQEVYKQFLLIKSKKFIDRFEHYGEKNSWPGHAQPTATTAAEDDDFDPTQYHPHQIRGASRGAEAVADDEFDDYPPQQLQQQYQSENASEAGIFDASVLQKQE